MSDTRPGPLQRLGYLLGRPLPESMRPWVQRDVTGPGHLRRYILRGFLPLLPFAVVLVFLPGSWALRVGMVILLATPLIYFEIALAGVYRRHLLFNNGLDPRLADKPRVMRIEEAQALYLAQHRSQLAAEPSGSAGAAADPGGHTVDDPHIIESTVVESAVVESSTVEPPADD
jgi:hypothetical protein